MALTTPAAVPYPRTLQQLEDMFSTEDQCRSYLARLRWAEGFACPKCRGKVAWLTARGLYHCKSCGHDTSATSGTILHRARLPLRTWFRAIWWVISQKNGASALGLKRILGLGSYETAWTWLHKLRRAMVRPGRDRLSGEVEVDETYVGGRSTRKNWHSHKVQVGVAAEVRGKAIGRIRLHVIGTLDCPDVKTFIRMAVTPGSTVITDGRQDYFIDPAEYKHDRRPVGWDRTQARRLLPRVHRVATLVKRWLLGTHHGRVERQHMPYYLDEFTFRFNRRTSRTRGWLFLRLVEQLVEVDYVPYAALVGGGNHKI